MSKPDLDFYHKVFAGADIPLRPPDPNLKEIPDPPTEQNDHAFIGDGWVHADARSHRLTKTNAPKDDG